MGVGRHGLHMALAAGGREAVHTGTCDHSSVHSAVTKTGAEGRDPLAPGIANSHVTSRPRS